MSNNQNSPLSDDRKNLKNLHICLFSLDESLTQLLRDILRSDRYALMEINNTNDFVEFVERQKEQIDCLVFIQKSSWQHLLAELKKLGVILPIVIVNAEASEPINNNTKLADIAVTDNIDPYHSAEIKLDVQKIDQIPSYINFAITQFLTLTPSCPVIERSTHVTYKPEETQNFLSSQQKRLAEKLQERLGYLGIYYKRNSQDFYHNLTEAQKQEFIENLSQEYRRIILIYFDDTPEVNKLIDSFVEQAFFADISVSQILEIHMDLMSEFAQQLKLEGRSEEILLDYRLALIDMIAHLCEMYRRSIPRENPDNIPFDVLFPRD